MKKIIFLLGFVFISIICFNSCNNISKYHVYKIHYTGMQCKKLSLQSDKFFGPSYLKENPKLEMTDLGYIDSLKLMEQIKYETERYNDNLKYWLDEYFKNDLNDPKSAPYQAALQTFIGAVEYYIVFDERYIKNNYEEILNKIISNKNIDNEYSKYIKIYLIYDGTEINASLISNEF